MDDRIRDFIRRSSAELAALMADTDSVLSGQVAVDGYVEQVTRELGRGGCELFFNDMGIRLSASLREEGYVVERAPRVRFLVAQGSIMVRSPYLRRVGERRGVRPLREVYGVEGGRCSVQVLRWMTAFGVEQSFGRASQSMVEHHGLEVPRTTIRKRTLATARDVETWFDARLADTPGASVEPAEEVLVQADGCMVPVVRWTSAGCLARTEHPPDKRLPKLEWIEVRTALAKAKDQVEPQFVCRVGDYDALTERLEGLVNRVGGALETQLVGGGDGANGLRDALKRRFPDLQYILDPGHLRGHLHAGAEALGCATPENAKAWVEEALRTLDTGGAEGLRRELEAPAALERRQNQGSQTKNTLTNLSDYVGRFADCVDYRTYRQRGWPIGSGEVESSHSYIPQDRLKVPGAWWLRESINPMCAARAVRENKEWNVYWDERAAA